MTAYRYQNRRGIGAGALTTARDLDAQAGDIIPTFVTPDDARRYIDEVNAAYSRLDTAIINTSSIPDHFRAAWFTQITAWKVFAASAKLAVGWFNTKAIMEQTDRYNDQLKTWYSSFQSVGGIPPGPPPPSDTKTSDVKHIALIVGGIAALLIFGPKLARAL